MNVSRLTWYFAIAECTSCLIKCRAKPQKEFLVVHLKKGFMAISAAASLMAEASIVGVTVPNNYAPDGFYR